MTEDNDSYLSDTSLIKRSPGDGRVSCARYALVVSNVLFFTLGMLLLCLGVWLRWVPANDNLITHTTTSSTFHYIMTSTLVIMAAGGATVLLSVIGCAGAVSNSKYMLGMFFLFLVVLFVLLISVFGLGIWLDAKVKADMSRQLSTTFIYSYNGENATDHVSNFWNRIQSDLKCCGIATPGGHLDYESAELKNSNDHVGLKGAKFWRNLNVTVWPRSCCVKSSDGKYVDIDSCKTNRNLNPARFSDGCKDKVQTFLSKNLVLVTVLAAILAVIEVIHFVTVRQLEAALQFDDNVSIATKFSFEV